MDPISCQYPILLEFHWILLFIYPITALYTDDSVGPSADTQTADRTHTGYDLGSGSSAGCKLYSTPTSNIDHGYVKCETNLPCFCLVSLLANINIQLCWQLSKRACVYRSPKSVSIHASTKFVYINFPCSVILFTIFFIGIRRLPYRYVCVQGEWSLTQCTLYPQSERL